MPQYVLPFPFKTSIISSCVTFHNKLTFYHKLFLVSKQSLNLRTTLVGHAPTAYSVYMQLVSISGGRVVHPPPEDKVTNDEAV
jgi:hypothetical protein